MSRYYVIQNASCPGTEFNSWESAASFLRSMQAGQRKAWADARIVGPGMGDDDYGDELMPSLFDNY